MARRDDAYSETNLKQRNRCCWFALTDFLLFGGFSALMWAGYSEIAGRYAPLALMLLCFWCIFPAYAILHGILSRLVTKRVIIPNLIFLLVAFLSMAFTWLIYRGTLVEVLLFSISVSAIFTAISTVFSLLTKGIMKLYGKYRFGKAAPEPATQENEA